MVKFRLLHVIPSDSFFVFDVTTQLLALIVQCRPYFSDEHGKALFHTIKCDDYCFPFNCNNGCLLFFFFLLLQIDIILRNKTVIRAANSIMNIILQKKKESERGDSNTNVFMLIIMRRSGASSANAYVFHADS